MYLSNLYDSLTVEVHCGDSVGSGCIVHNPSYDLTYIVTAKHCLEGTGPTPQSFSLDDINIKNLINGEWIEYTPTNFYLHPEADLAVITVEKIQTLPLSIITEDINFREQVTISGYPKALQEHPENPNQNILGSITYITKNRIEFKTVDRMDTFSNEAKSYIKGFSGSGIYKEIGNKIVLLGVFTEVKEKNVAYQILVGEPINKVNEILIENSLPKIPTSTPPYILQRMGDYKYLWEWEREARLSNSKWVDFEHSSNIIHEITSHFSSLDGNNVLHIIGRSGIGKTRTLLKACQQTDDLKNVLYFPNYNAMDNDFIKYVKENESVQVKIVIDDISLDEWQSLNREFFQYYERVRIITIGVVAEHKQNRSEGLLIIEPPSNPDIELLINTLNPSLNTEDKQYLMDLCNGDLRLIILLIEVLGTGEFTLPFSSMNSVRTKFDSVQSIMDRVIEKYNTEIRDKQKFLDQYITFCLFVDIGFTGAYRREVEYLGQYFNINQPDLSATIEKSTSCRLGIVKGEFFEPSPRALARLVFENESWGLIKHDLDNFITNMPTTAMRKRFINRAEECGVQVRNEVQAALAAWFRGKFSSNSLSFLMEEDNTKIFKVFTEFSPINGLLWLKRTILSATDDEILELHHYHSRTRRYLVWLCEHLACFQEHFRDTEEIIFKLAQNETEKHISNNSQGVWSGFFLPILSNTQIPFMDRFSLYLTRLQVCKLEDLTFVLKTFDLMFSDSLSRMAPPKVVGGRIVPPEWQPESYNELFLMRKDAAKLFIGHFDNLQKEKKNVVIEFIIDNITLFINYGALREVRQLLSDIDPELTIRLKHSLDDFINHTNNYEHNNKTMLPEVVEWRESFKYKNLEEEILEFISKDYWNYLHFSDEQTINAEVEVLVKRVINENINLHEFGKRLDKSTTNITSLMKFAENLGYQDDEEIFKEFILSSISRNTSHNFVISYLQGRKLKIGNINSYANYLDVHSLSHTEFIVSITLATDVSAEGYLRLKTAIDSGSLSNASIFYGLAANEWNSFLPENLKVELITLILEKIKSSDVFHIVLKLLNRWYYRDPSYSSPEMANLSLIILEKCLLEDNIAFDDWDWKEVAIRVSEAPQFIRKKCELLVAAMTKWMSGHYNLRNYALEEVIKIAGRNSEMLMQIIGYRMLDSEDRYSFMVYSYKNLFESLNLVDVEKWIENIGGIDGAVTIARHIKSPTPKEDDKLYVPPLTKWLLSKFEIEDRVFNAFLAGRHSFEVFNVAERINNHDKLVEDLSPYLDHELRRIREWAEYEIKDSESFRDSEEIMKAREQREY